MITLPGRAANYCSERVCNVCLYICLSARMSKMTCPNYYLRHKIFCMLPVAVGPPLMTMKYVMYFSFVDDAVCPQWSTWHVAKRECSQSDSPGAELGQSPDDCDCFFYIFW